ncbi:aquaporin [Streptomyces sp. NPDC005917]|uniref:MIP/aquaporin family protein n=1 Tax=unclassified Streptomyces TaxID=2593676 RepID=UPI003407F46A
MARNSAAECLLAFVLLMAVITIVRWVAGPSPVSAAIPEVHAELLIIGGCVGLVLAGLILSPPGKASGGHINPAISIAMWRFGLFPGASVTPYIAAQLAGSLLGALAGGAVWGPVTDRPPVRDASLQPGHGWSAGALFAAETASMGVIVLLVGLFVAAPRLAPLVPWLVGLLIGAAIALLGTTTGGSVNPARQFGPAIVAGRLDFLWVYLLAPMAGAVLAASLCNTLVGRHTPPGMGAAKPTGDVGGTARGGGPAGGERGRLPLGRGHARQGEPGRPGDDDAARVDTAVPGFVWSACCWPPARHDAARGRRRPEPGR